MSLAVSLYKRLKTPFSFIVNHTIFMLTILFALGAALILWHLNYLSEIQIRSTALKNAQLYSETLTEFRTLYTSEVAVRAKKSGLEVTHDYATKENAIPLPATLSMLLGNRLGGKDGGVKSKLYSKYPFPWRETTGGITDNFGKDAWEALQKKSNEPFYRFEDVNGRPSLRYATADLMRKNCVNCHNNHPDTPKDDWRIGQLRGVLEVVTPVDSHIATANNMIRQTSYLLSAILVVSLIGVGSVMRKLRFRSIEAQSYASTTARTNKRLAEEMEVRKKAEENLRKLTYTDALTGIENRRKFDEEFDIEWKRARRNHSYLALVLIDIDYFKAYNDNYGHQAGDQTLRRVAEAMQTTSIRCSDTIARFGGEEFILLMPETDLAGATKMAENLRRNIESSAIPHDFSPACNVVTISAGVAVATPAQDSRQEDLISDADQALYYAKHSGRNCVKARDGEERGQTETLPSLTDNRILHRC